MIILDKSCEKNHDAWRNMREKIKEIYFDHKNEMIV